MKLIKILAIALLTCAGAVEAAQVYPGKQWASREPEQVGLNARKLKELSDYAGGFGCVVRHGYMVHTWGNAGRRKDVASAAKPLYSHFLFKALEDGKISSLDERAGKWQPQLNEINEGLGYKDRNITWRHFANQISCYGLAEAPGTAYAYNDWQMALFWDTLFKNIYGADFETVDDEVFHPLLTDNIQCQDNPTFLAFGVKDRAGRLAISPRDFARFGLLYLRKGRWKDEQLISRKHAQMAVTSPLPNSILRAGTEAAEMIPGQRSIGSKRIPDNQCDHAGSYSWLWWTNGVSREGKRHWPDVPTDAYGCFGHGGPRAMVVIPSQDLIISWNDAKIRSAEMENHALRLLVDAVGGKGRDFGNRAAAIWEPVEWSIENVEYSGNPFDVAAKATFTHSETGKRRTTEMFYDGDDTWRFRFTGTLVGKWSFETSSDAPELHGRTGSVSVERNHNQDVKGFLTYVGNKYAIQMADETDLHGYLFNVYMSRVEYPAYLDEFDSDPKQVEQQARTYLKHALDTGFETVFVSVDNNWFKLGVREHNKHDSENPDLPAFRVLETIIRTVHASGGRVHIWAWGDEQRKWTPKGVPGGVNGKADRRLQRYIAARLGPLPGWTMGYGFDLHEWTNTEQLNAWAKYMHEHLGWQHLLCARGHVLEGPDNINSYDGFGRNVALTATRHGPADYQEIAEDMDGDLTRPHLYEERHSYKRDGFNLDMDGTRRLLWRETMAGGMGGFYGFYPTSPYPYPNPEQLRTHYTFWHKKDPFHKRNRFKLDMKRANQLSDGGYVLSDPSKQNFVFYYEDAQSITVDLTGMQDIQNIIAVDTKKEYQEWWFGSARDGKVILWAPYHSDWALAIDSKYDSVIPANLVIVDPEQPQWLARLSAQSFFMCGPGDPEDFLYRGKLQPDGTRDGDQMALIDKLKGTGANCVYLMAIRSHGGDGDRTHNPFVDNDPQKGINEKVLDQWEQWFTEMDENNIVIYFFIYDDNVRVWNTGDTVGDEERKFLRTLVSRFEHHGNLIWCVAEEYQEKLSVERVKNIAAEIRAADVFNHPIAAHKLNGLEFSEFADEPNIDQFAIQYNITDPDELHDAIVGAWKEADGRYNLNMSEAKDWGTGRELRLRTWACAMGGAYVMILGMDIAATPKSDLEDCGKLAAFFESTYLDEMAPHDELRFAGTKYVLARPGYSYIAYAPQLQGKMGLKNLKAGTYTLRWYDCVTGKWVVQKNVNVSGGDQSWSKPDGIGDELALHIWRVIRDE